MKKYLITAATIFFGIIISFILLMLIGLFGMWDLGRFPELFESEGFWNLVRITLVISLIIPLFSKFKIVKI